MPASVSGFQNGDYERLTVAHCDSAYEPISYCPGELDRGSTVRAS